MIDTKKPPKYGVVGSGPSGIYALKHLVASASPRTEITMFESADKAGYGMPYSADWVSHEMLSNITSLEIPPVIQSLQGWLESCSDAELSRMQLKRSELSERRFYPRTVLGDFYADQLQKLLVQAKHKKIHVNILTSAKVTDVEQGATTVRLEYQKNHVTENQTFEHVILSTGHQWPDKKENQEKGYFTSPWPSKKLKNIESCHVGVRGTSLSAIDAVVAMASAKGKFVRNESGLHYEPNPGTEAFQETMFSRKGLLPEADSYFPLPYRPTKYITEQSIEKLIAEQKVHPERSMLDKVFELIKKEITLSDPEYAKKINLSHMDVAAYSDYYFAERLKSDPFEWAKENLKKATQGFDAKKTEEWRGVFVSIHHLMNLLPNQFLAEDYLRFDKYLKPVLMDSYASVPHESIERLLALREAKKINIMAIGDDYSLSIDRDAKGASLRNKNGEDIHFPIFIDAIGQKTLAAQDWPFPTLKKQGYIADAVTEFSSEATGQADAKTIPGERARTQLLHGKPHLMVGGIEVDARFHPVGKSGAANRIHCISLPFIMGKYPLVQGLINVDHLAQVAVSDCLPGKAAQRR